MDNDPSPDTREEIAALLARTDAEGDKDLRERFVGPLEFGTAGLRGVLGAGESRMNRAVVLRTTHGLGTELLRAVTDAKTRGVVIGFDGRRLSRTFAEDTACVLAALGVRAHLFTDVVPTPVTSFGVKHLGAAAGVMVTASHNPPEYNGYKVYWERSAQIIPPVDVEIARAIEGAPPAKDVPRMDMALARKAGLVTDVEPSVLAAYDDAVAALRFGGRARRDLRIVYTAMHGVGNKFALRALARAGFTDVFSVPEQAEPDGAFPTVAFPNPEEKGAMDLALSHARDRNAELDSGQRSGRRSARCRHPIGALRDEVLAAHGQSSGRAAWAPPARARSQEGQGTRPRVDCVVAGARQHRAHPRRPVRRDAHGVQVDREPRDGSGA